MRRRRNTLTPDARDRRIREAERAAYAAYGLTPVERTAQFNGPTGQLSVRVNVFGEPGDAPPVVLLHGIASATVLAAPLLPFLHDRQVFAVDWPGHGLSASSTLPPTLPFRTYAVEVIRALLDELGLQQVDLVGHSLGAQISLYSALDLGSRVRRIVLLGAPGASLEGTRPLAAMKALAVPRLGAVLLSIPMSDQMFERNNEMALGRGALNGVPDELVEALRLVAGRTSNAASIASFFRGLIKRGSLREGVTLTGSELGRITQPTLMAWGDDDVFLTPLDGARAIVSIRDVHLARVRGAGHAPWLQAPDTVGDAVAAHLHTDRPERDTARGTNVRRQTVTTEPTRVDFPSASGITIAAYRWDPATPPRAIAQITHGVGEYALRYTPLIEKLVEAGFVVYAHDHRGHGATVRSGEEPGALGAGGWAQLVADIGRMGKVARTANPSLKLVLIAHSLGSFATQQYLLDHSADVDAVALSGTASIDLLEPALDLDAPMDLAMFNAAFEPARTAFDWLSRDENQVDLYLNDPQCGFGLDIAGGKDMFVSARQLADPERVAGMRPDLPVYLTVGDMDPVNGQLALVQALVDRYDKAGLDDVTLKAYAGARHEVFNETNRDEVVNDLIDWLDEILT
jgi:alpha-beta hydrolase superfamily lysophospholipase